MVINNNMNESVEHDGFFSIFSEIELVVKGQQSLIGFCIDYMPASIEVLKPENFNFTDSSLTKYINDILAKLHEVDMIAKRLGTDNNFLKRNMNSIIINSILIFTKLGINTLDKIVTATGINKDEIKIYVDKLIKENKIKEDSGAYFIV